MKTKPLTFLLSLAFLFLFSGSSVVFAVLSDEGLRDALNPNHNLNYEKLSQLNVNIDMNAHEIITEARALGWG